MLVLMGTLYSLVGSRFPVVFPGFSPLMAIAFVGAMYLPRQWGWAVGPVVVAITTLAYLATNYKVYGDLFSVWSFVYMAIYGAAGLLGILIATRKSLAKIIGGSIACSLMFYVVSNSISWMTFQAPEFANGYAPTLAGWWQANTVGVLGFEPTWCFLRNGMMGDLFFAMLLVIILDRKLIWGHAPGSTSTQAA